MINVEPEFRFEPSDSGDMRLVKVSVVDLATVDLTQRPDGTLGVEKKDSRASGDKYRLVPEGDLLRIIANRDVGRDVWEGVRGGLVSHATTLSHSGLCWIDEGSQALGNVRVYGDALVLDGSVLSGSYRVGGNAYLREVTASGLGSFSGGVSLLRVAVDSAAASVSIDGLTELRDSALSTAARRQPIAINGGRAEGADIRCNEEFVTYFDHRYGHVTSFRDTQGQVAVMAGCQRVGSFDKLRELGSREGLSPVRAAMLEGFIVLAQAAKGGWVDEGPGSKGEPFEGGTADVGTLRPSAPQSWRMY